MSRIYPGLNRVLIKELELPEAKDALIVSSAKPFKYGEIVAIGSIKDKENIDDTMFKVGDKVYYLGHIGTKIELEELGEVLLLNIQEILVGRQDN